jgi:tetratricopeptide (TPR) repeat protein
VNDDEGSIRSQSNNSVEGDMSLRDINKNIFNQTSAINIFVDINLQESPEYLKFVLDKLNSTFHVMSEITPIQEALIKFKNQLENIVPSDKSMPKKNFPQTLKEAAAFPIEQQQFGVAHNIFASVIEGPKNEIANSVLKDYLITGFINYSQENDMAGLKKLLSKGARFSNSEDPEIDLLIANIFQEICSRESNLDNLTNYMTTLEGFYANASTTVKPSMANSLGLANRRLGERTGTELLHKAISIFNEGLSFNKNNIVLEVDLKDQKAISYVRIFEYNKDISSLNEAENLLTDCVKLLAPITEYRGIRLKPRVLNNLGNVYKQKSLHLETEKIQNARKAIGCYQDAEEFWTEASAKYEWALLKKNKAEAKYALGKVCHDTTLLIEALDDCSLAVKYRNFDNSPFQWGKTVEVSFKIVLLLEELKKLTLISKPLREIVIHYTQQIDNNDSLWGAKNFTNFLTNAKQAQLLLKNL